MLAFVEELLWAWTFSSRLLSVTQSWGSWRYGFVDCSAEFYSDHSGGSRELYRAKRRPTPPHEAYARGSVNRGNWTYANIDNIQGGFTTAILQVEGSCWQDGSLGRLFFQPDLSPLLAFHHVNRLLYQCDQLSSILTLYIYVETSLE
jgi:hypothetical protein